MKPDSCNKPCDLTKHGPKDSIKAQRPLPFSLPPSFLSFILLSLSLSFAPLCFSLAAEATDGERGCAHKLTNIDQTGQLTFATDRGQERPIHVHTCVYEKNNPNKPHRSETFNSIGCSRAHLS